MKGRGLIFSALAIYATVVLGSVTCSRNESSADGGSSLPTSGAASRGGARSERAAGLPFRGAGMQIQRVDWIDQYKKSIDEVADIGGDTVLLVVDSRMENGTSSAIYLDMRMTPNPEQLGSVIDHAKKRGLRVWLMPIVLLDKPKGWEWRGTINPPVWKDWWESYRSMLFHYSWIAEAHHVDVLVVGSELVSTEDKTDEWRQTIAGVRKTFKGQLTYSANWDHFRNIGFWKDLDLFATNCYYKLGKDRNVGEAEVLERWAEIQKNVLGFAAEIGRPHVFTEVGWCSMTNAADEPWDYTKELPEDQDLQKRLYEAFFKAWHGKADSGGFMIWEWTPGDGGKGNKGYTPEGKPAEKVMREWFAKPRWEVKK